MRLAEWSPQSLLLNPAQSGGFAGSFAGAMQQAPEMYKQLAQNAYLIPLLKQKLAQAQAQSTIQGAKANNAAQLYQGEANAATGYGQQQLSGGQFANKINAANIQNTQAQANASQANANATPYNTANNIANTLLNHHVQQILSNHNLSLGGQQMQKLLTSLQNMPLGGSQNGLNFMNNTNPIGSSSGASSGNNMHSKIPPIPGARALSDGTWVIKDSSSPQGFRIVG